MIGILMPRFKFRCRRRSSLRPLKDFIFLIFDQVINCLKTYQKVSLLPRESGNLFWGGGLPEYIRPPSKLPHSVSSKVRFSLAEAYVRTYPLETMLLGKKCVQTQVFMSVVIKIAETV